MKKTLLFGFLCWAFISCQPIMKKVYGIKNPDIENKKTILRKAEKYDLDTSNIVTVNSKDFFRVLKGKAIPDAAIYDTKGRYIEYRKADTSCNAGLFQFIPSLNLTDKYNQPDSSNLDSELKKFRTLNGQTLASLAPADFYLLIYWTVWTGKLNKDHVKAWEDLAINNKRCKIKVVKVNLDMQEYWNKEERDKIANTMKKRR